MRLTFPGQIHTHMCYSNFNDIIHSIINMDADVITIENSRSDEKLLSVFREGVTYGAGIGPGVYDIHSPRIDQHCLLPAGRRNKRKAPVAVRGMLDGRWSIDGTGPRAMRKSCSATEPNFSRYPWP